MFRWTAGTKARADRAARLHPTCTGPGRLLLASRPTLQRTASSSSSPPPPPEAARAQNEAPRASSPSVVRSPAPSRGAGASPGVAVKTAVSTEEVTPDLVEGEERGAVAVAADERPSATPKGGDENAAEVPHQRSLDASLEPSHTRENVRPTSNTAAAAAPAPQVLPSSSAASVSHADQLVRAALAEARRGTRRHRAHHHRGRHHRRHRRSLCDDRRRSRGSSSRSSSSSSSGGGGRSRRQGEYSMHERGVCDEGDASGGAESDDSSCGGSLYSASTDTPLSTYRQLQRQQRRLQRRHSRMHGGDTLDDGMSRYTDELHHSSSHARHAHEQVPAPPPVPPARPAVSVDCVSVQQPLHRRQPPPESTTPPSIAPSSIGRRRERYALDVPSQWTATGVGAAAAFAVTPRWSGTAADRGETNAASGASEESAMVTVVADHLYKTTPEDGAADAALFREPAAQRGFAESRVPLPYEIAGGDPRRLTWGVEPLQHRRQHATQEEPQPCTPMDFEDRPLRWAATPPVALCDGASRDEGEGEESAEGVLDAHLWPPPRHEVQGWAADDAFFPPPRPSAEWGSPAFPLSAWSQPAPPSSSQDRPATAPWLQRAVWWEGESNAPAMPFAPRDDPARLPYDAPWCAPPPFAAREAGSEGYRDNSMNAWGGRGGWSREPMAALQTFPPLPVAPLGPPPPQMMWGEAHAPWSPSSGLSSLPPVTLPVPQLSHQGVPQESSGVGGLPQLSTSGGGRGRRGQQRPPSTRALTGTTERCRRFWERCRQAPDLRPPQPF